MVREWYELLDVSTSDKNVVVSYLFIWGGAREGM